MPTLYPPAPAQVQGDNLSISRFLNDPTLIARRLRTLAEQRFISDVLLTATYTTESGAFLYEQNESIYADRQPRAIAPGGEYPLTPISNGPAQLANTVKWGEDFEVTDESVSRQKMTPVNKAMLKMVNQMVRTVDSISLAAIASTVTQTMAVTEAWTTGSAALNIFRDIELAKAQIKSLNEGYDPDTLVVDDVLFANIISDKQFALLLPRESTNTPVHTGSFVTPGGLRVLASPNLPTPGTAIILDTTQLGGMGREDIESPGYSSAGGVGVEAKTIREDKNDQWRLRCRRITVPIVTDPNAAIVLTGVGA